MPTTEIASGVERAQDLVTRGPLAFVAAVFAVAFLSMLVLYVRDARSTREASVQLAVAAHLLLEAQAELEAKLEGKRRKRPSSNPGAKPKAESA